MAFVHRAMSVTIKLGKGSFGDSGFDTVKFNEPLRASAEVENVGGPNMARCDLTVYGLSLNLMNQIATLGPIRNIEGVRNNEVIVEAGDTTNGLGVVFQGTIREAFLDFSGMPDCALRLQSFTGTMLAVRPVPPSSYNGLADVATVFASLAKQANVSFQNNGVTAKLIDPYFSGTVWDQMERCAQAAGINWLHDAQSNAVIIWPGGGSRSGAVPVISATTGMIGYPNFTSLGINCSCLYNPSLSVGQTVKIESVIRGATGKWTLRNVWHHLESETPGGQWASNFFATPNSDDVAVPGR